MMFCNALIDPNSKETENKPFCVFYFGWCGLTGEGRHFRIPELFKKVVLKV